jgi:hypothetical protein
MTREAARRALAVPALFALAIGLFARADAQPLVPSTLSMPGYLAWLDSVAADVADDRAAPSADVLRRIPPVWRVQTDSGFFDVPNAWLIRDLRELQGRPGSEARGRIRGGLRALRAAALGFDAPPEDRSEARARRDEILASREFRSVHGPTWRDRLRQRILQIILSVLERLFGSSVIPTVSNILVYTLIAIAVSVVAIATYRSLTRSAAIESIVPDRTPVSAKPWQLWLADAQASAARGDWRDAMRLAYWCGVSYLEMRGAWRPDRARTPREYLRLMAASDGRRDTLSALTRSFELVWYGTDRADARTFNEAVAHLEKLGCRAA